MSLGGLVVWAWRLAVALLVVYAACLVYLVLDQRRMMYFPAPAHGTAAEQGLAQAQTLALMTSDGERLVAWYQPAATGKLIFLLFHGNGGSLDASVGLLRQLAADGSGFFAIDYRGYGGSTGSPSERGFLRDGDAAYAQVRDFGYAPNRIVILGQSIGSGVAVAMAATHPIRALVLDSAFSATVDIAATRYWMFPVRLLMRDTFESRERIGQVAAPKLFLHGTADDIVPIAFGQRLFARAGEPKTFMTFPGLGHLVLWSPGVVDRMKAWLRDVT